MGNAHIASMLYNIADILELQGVQFKPHAYRRAARSVENFPQELSDVVKKEGIPALRQVPGVGESIAEKIEEFLRTGKLKYYDHLRKKIPRHVFELMSVSGLGPRKVKVLHEKLGISTMKQLEAAARTHQIRNIPTFGRRSEDSILKGIALVKFGQERMLLGHALPQALEVERYVRQITGVRQSSIAGSLRRKRETIGDIDILAAAAHPPSVTAAFTKMPGVSRVLAKGNTKASVLIDNNLQVDLRVVSPSSFGAALQYFTGSKEHNVSLRERAKKRGFKVNEYGVFRGSKKVAGKTELDVYRALHLPFIEPELRENTGELDTTLPNLIKYTALKGDFHLHTHASDGSDSIERMVAAAKKRGYDYIAITDHSKSLRIAHGLSEDQMATHIKRIRDVAKKTKGIRVLAGTEVDILPNGELDYSSELLKKFDIVVASVHSGFKMPREKMTARIIAAVQNKYTDILGHPTGRLIGKRAPYDIDLNKVFNAAAQNKVHLEINAQPERSDLKDTYVRKAKAHGCTFTIDTDAHDTQSLQFMQFGIAIARRGWLEEKDVVNTFPATKLSKFFRRIK